MNEILSMFHLAANACGTNTGLLPSLYDGLVCAPDSTGTLAPELTSVSNILIILGNVLRILLALSGGIAIIVIITAGIFYATSLGDPARIKRGKEILINTTIGLGLMIAAYAIVTFIIEGF